ncbi:phosphoribosylanthranilate isomerase [Bradyrhizobium sp. BR13661]|uniref:phosphoribosylanthranilate isomerase n=1 Tax=Bradyrhizobium sp. BR13661 TaxID=2940622 RepID=UPI0024742C10|nr:phosphoribosylanthranilate isomerase [Bradyrhizobium sp. BR13661]MDH6262736.1 phosphoribosylanthranilate isomerase [Bradyrhizobium sp. BR13661]
MLNLSSSHFDPNRPLTKHLTIPVIQRFDWPLWCKTMLTQIYEVATPAEAEAISAIGVDHVGVLVGDGAFPRELSVQKASTVMKMVRAPSVLSALFLSADIALIERMARELDPPIVHLGASTELLTPDLVVALRKSLPKVKFMRSVPVTGPEAVSVAQAYDQIVDWILLDSHRIGDLQIGAQGVTHDWSIGRMIVENVRTPVILAGGLGPDNVKRAIGSVRPAGVDSKTRTDQEGTHSKDLSKVEAFYRAATSN